MCGLAGPCWRGRRAAGAVGRRVGVHVLQRAGPSRGSTETAQRRRRCARPCAAWACSQAGAVRRCAARRQPDRGAFPRGVALARTIGPRRRPRPAPGEPPCAEPSPAILVAAPCPPVHRSRRSSAAGHEEDISRPGKWRGDLHSAAHRRNRHRRTGARPDPLAQLRGCRRVHCRAQSGQRATDMPLDPGTGERISHAESLYYRHR